MDSANPIVTSVAKTTGATCCLLLHGCNSFSVYRCIPSNPLTFDNCHEITQILTENADHRKMIFGVKTVPAYSVNSFFFQLVTTKILTFKWTNNKTSLCCSLAKDEIDHYKFKILCSWNGFEC